MQKKYQFYSTEENKDIYMNTTFDVKVRIPSFKKKILQITDIITTLMVWQCSVEIHCFLIIFSGI